MRGEWLRRVEAEYRSAAITQHLTLWLIQIGASPDLVRGGLRIAADEMAHAELSHRTFVAAGGVGGPQLARESLELKRHPGAPLEHDVARVGVEVYCLGETVAVPLFKELREPCSVPVARRALDRILRDEVRHRDFGWALLGWLVEHSADVGIDPNHIALLGHSAGAGIVASLATDPAYLRAAGLEPADLGCVGPLDTEAFSVAEAIGGGPELAKVYRVAFGTDPEQWAELSPLTHVGEAPIPPLFLVSRGTASRTSLVATFAAAVDTAGGETTIVDLPTFSHEDVNKRIGDPADTRLTPALQDFLTACLTG